MSWVFFLSIVDRLLTAVPLPAKPLTNACKLRYAHPVRLAATRMAGQAVRRADFLCAVAYTTELAIDRP